MQSSFSPGNSFLHRLHPLTKLVALPAAGHMLMSERPYEVIDAIAAHLRG